jgi:hypothetical protein
MALVLHEVWRERDPQNDWLDWRLGFCLAGPDGDAFRKRLTTDWVCTYTFEAGSRAHAIAEYTRVAGQENAPAREPQDDEPYAEEWAERQRGDMSKDELRAYGAVAQALADNAFDMASNDDASDQFPGLGPIYYHYSMSTFEWTAQTLWRLKILRPVDMVANNWAHLFAFNCELRDAGDVAITNFKSGPLLRKLIENFLYLYDDYSPVTGFSSAANQWFGAGSPLEPTFEALVAIGYLEKSSEGYRWTSLATTAMYSTGHWEPSDSHRPDPTDDNARRNEI